MCRKFFEFYCYRVLSIYNICFVVVIEDDFDIIVKGLNFYCWIGNIQILMVIVSGIKLYNYREWLWYELYKMGIECMILFNLIQICIYV